VQDQLKRQEKEMAKLEINPMFNSVKGSLNEITFRRMYGRHTIMKKLAMSQVESSEAR
jgi:hypothetical protein